MAYEVLALKYRPRVFEDLVGQEAVSRTLTNAIQQDRIAHAFLFAGVRGVGKTTTARILAKALNCASGPTVRPCGECAACREIAAGRSMDVLEIDGASHTKVDEFRELLDTVQYAPSRDRYKIYIVDEVHMLSTHSFNALLKTLEEPPPHVKFIFATTEQHKIPDTIRSRCQEFEFRTVAPSEITAQLQKIAEAEAIEIEPAALAAIARVAAGSLRDGVSALDQVIAASGKAVTESDVTELLGLIEREVLRDCLRAIVARDAHAILRTVDGLVKGGRDLRYFTSALMQYLRDVLVVRVAPHAGELIEVPDDRPDLEALAGSLTEDDLVRALNVLAEAELALRTSPEPRFHLEVSLLKLSQLGRLASFEELLERFEALVDGKPVPPPSSSSPSPSSSSSSSSSAPSSSAPSSSSPSSPPASSPMPSSSSWSPSSTSPSSKPQPIASPNSSSSPQPAPAPGDVVTRLIEKLKASKPMLHAVVARHERASFENGRLTLVFGREQKGVAAQLDSDSALYGMLVEQLAEVAGSKAAVAVELEVEPCAPEGPGDEPSAAATATATATSTSTSTSTSTVRESGGSSDELRARAERDPLVRQFVETFQGEVEDVRRTDSA